jgi:hypothetical protein
MTTHLRLVMHPVMKWAARRALVDRNRTHSSVRANDAHTT